MDFIFPFLNNSIRSNLSSTCKDLYCIHEDVPIEEYTGPYDPKVTKVRNLTLKDTDYPGTLRLPLCEYLHLENSSVEKLDVPRLKYIRSDFIYDISVHTYDFGDICASEITTWKPIHAKQIIANHCVLQRLRNVNDYQTIMRTHCSICGTSNKRSLSATTLIIQDTYINDNTYYDSENVHFFNCTFSSRPQLSSQLKHLSWTTNNALVSDFPVLPKSLVYFNVEENFVLQECPRLPLNLQFLYLMHTGIKQQLRIVQNLKYLKELSINVDDNDLQDFSMIPCLNVLHICYKGSNMNQFMEALKTLNVDLKELSIHLRFPCFSKDKIRKLFPRALCKIQSCRY